MGDEQNVEAEAERAPEAGIAESSSESAPIRVEAPQPAPHPAMDTPSEPMDFDETTEHSYTISDVYRARRVNARQWVGRDTTPSLFAEVGDWLVTRPDGGRFIMFDKEFHARFTLTSVLGGDLAG